MSSNGHHEAPPDLHVAAPWERQDAETENAYRSFCVYRDDPDRPRSLLRTASNVGKGHDQMRKWSAKYGWVERCRLYDRDQERRQMEAERVATVKMGKRHAGIAATFLEVGTKPAIELLRRWKEDPLPFSAQSDDELFDKFVKFVRVVPGLVGVERLSRGQSTMNLGVGEDVAEGIKMPEDLRGWMGQVYAEIERLNLPEPDQEDAAP